MGERVPPFAILSIHILYDFMTSPIDSHICSSLSMMISLCQDCIFLYVFKEERSQVAVKVYQVHLAAA